MKMNRSAQTALYALAIAVCGSILFVGAIQLVMKSVTAPTVPAQSESENGVPPLANAPAMDTARTAESYADDHTLDWAYPNAAPDPNAEPDPAQTFTALGSPTGMKLTMQQINDPFSPPDWFPDDHAPMPNSVSHGRPPQVRACMQCHLANGEGHPESSSIAGLTVAYIIEQTHAFRDDNRNNSRSTNMVVVAKNIAEEDLQQAAVYFAAIKPSGMKWVRVVETAEAPASHVVSGGGRYFDKNSSATVPVPPTQIFEVAENDEVKLRNPQVGFVAFVPPGSIEKGRVVALGSHGRMRTCASCHGEGLKGHEDVPPLAGRSPTYLVRQMSDIRIGARKGPNVKDMEDIVGKMSNEDIVNVAAYMASLNP